jgi:fructose-1-phosphate kinase PfkB-like protein
MRNARYYILNDRDQWLIKYNDEEFGPYLTQAEATLFAVEAAQKLSDRGANAVVYLMGDNGRFRREWTCEQAALA